MCSPALAIAAVAVAVSAYGTYSTIQSQNQAADAASKQAAYQAAVANNNAILADRAAQDATARGKAAAANNDLQVRELIGRQRAVLAQNGVETDVGSALDLTSGTAAEGKYQELVIRNNAAREAYGFQTQGLNYRADADLSLIKGSNAATAYGNAATGSLLSGVGSVADRWYTYRKDLSFGGGDGTGYPAGGITPG